MACTAPACADTWREKHASARQAAEESRLFEAVQLINAALESFENSQAGTGTEQQGMMLTDPARFAAEAAGSMAAGAKVDLAGLWATRADILMGLGGLKRAAGELGAAALLAPEETRVKELLAECEKLQKYQEEGIAEDAVAATQNKVPVHILTGFLGSGKTTLLNHILRESHTKRYAVIENEFGEIGIDDKLIARREDLGAEQIIEMNNGCICCTVRGDLIQGLRSILKKTSLEGTKLDGVIIETTGLADPAPVAQTFFADDVIQSKMLLDGIITMIDAKHALQHLREEKPEGVENEAVEQVAFADRIIINKTDLVSSEEVKVLTDEIRAINRLVPIIYTQNAKVDLTEIIGIKGFSLDRVLEADSEFLRDEQEHQHDQTVSSVGIECPGECDQARLNAWIAKLLTERGTDIFRTKGVLAVKGSDHKFVFQGIHMIFGGQPQDPWPSGERVNRLIFIGRNLDRAELETGFKSTLA
ncbi:CBWD1 [Symbiodinium natans]|uniref:CBWD1 protein n=1 Tax=Symbiodinium natans TaxID=878477 RepID=A0A812J058_9DINO|nr:CBWD1 [Symbiodinium natans]